MSSRPPEELIARHEAFLACEPVDRPLVGLWLGGYYPADQFPRGTAAWRNGQTLTPDDVRLTDAFALDYENLYRLHRDVDDDFFYVGSAYWGIPWIEAILGCRIVAGKTTSWAHPCPGGLAGSMAAGPLEQNAWFHCLLDWTRRLLDLSAGRFPVCPPLMRGPGDAANAVVGGMDMVMTYVDDPDAARQTLEHCAAVRLEVVRRLNEIVPAWHGTYAAGGYPSKVWSRRRVAYNQDDAAALLSPGLFRQFLLPMERRQCQAAEVNFIHLHSGCLYPVDILLEDDSYAVLEINIDHEGTAPPLADLIPTFRRIQAARRPLLLWGEIKPDGWRRLIGELSPAGLSLQPIVADPSNASVYIRR